MSSVAFLGPLGTYSHQATLELFGEQFALLPCETITAVFDAVAARQASAGVVPIRNSTAGPVAETAEQLQRHRKLLLDGKEHALKIGHTLLRQRGATGAVEKVFSHEQALQQCARYLQTHCPDARRTETPSTAGAAARAASEPDAVAISSIVCAQLYDLEVLAPNIQDAGPANTTFFVTLKALDKD